MTTWWWMKLVGNLGLGIATGLEGWYGPTTAGAGHPWLAGFVCGLCLEGVARGLSEYQQHLRRQVSLLGY